MVRVCLFLYVIASAPHFLVAFFHLLVDRDGRRLGQHPQLVARPEREWRVDREDVLRLAVLPVSLSLSLLLLLRASLHCPWSVIFPAKELHCVLSARSNYRFGSKSFPEYILVFVYGHTVTVP